MYRPELGLPVHSLIASGRPSGRPFKSLRILHFMQVHNHDGRKPPGYLSERVYNAARQNAMSCYRAPARPRNTLAYWQTRLLSRSPSPTTVSFASGTVSFASRNERLAKTLLISISVGQHDGGRRQGYISRCRRDELES